MTDKQGVTSQQVYEALDLLRQSHRIQEVGAPGLSPVKCRYNVDGVEMSAGGLVTMADKEAEPIRIVVLAGKTFRGVHHFEEAKYDVSSELAKYAVNEGIARLD